MAVAFAVAIAIHEIVAGLIPRATSPPPEHEIVTNAVITHVTMRALPTPTPPPPPRAPQVVSHARVIASAEPRIVPQTTTGVSARREVIHRVAAARPKPPKFTNAKPIWDIPVGAQGAGAGKASGAGSVGTGGNGTGAGNAGTGTGAAAGTQPCGFVTFEDPHGARFDPQTRGFWVDVQMSVHFPDGHAESLLLDYPWYYPSAAQNPFQNESAPMLFQWPPADKRGAEPPVVQYVMQHSEEPGITLLKDCPQPSSNP
jgi:hypothetical protein